MNLILRFVWLLLTLPFIPKEPVLKVWKKKFRAWPHDCDINLHLTNSRYWSFADLARTYSLARLGVLRKMLKKKWAVVVQSQEITFLRQVNPFQKIWVETELIYWDEKYFYIEHHFVSSNALHAKGLIRGLFMQGRNVIPTEEVLELAGIDQTAPPEPDSVKTWKKHLEQKKKDSQ